MFWEFFLHSNKRKSNLRGDQGFHPNPQVFDLVHGKVHHHYGFCHVFFSGCFFWSVKNTTTFRTQKTHFTLDIISRCWCSECNPWFLMWLLLLWLQDGWLTSTDWRCLQVPTLWSNPHMTHVRAPCCWLRLRISTSCRQKHCAWFLCIYIEIIANQYICMYLPVGIIEREILFSQKIIPSIFKIPVIFT